MGNKVSSQILWLSSIKLMTVTHYFSLLGFFKVIINFLPLAKFLNLLISKGRIFQPLTSVMSLFGYRLSSLSWKKNNFSLPSLPPLPTAPYCRYWCCSRFLNFFVAVTIKKYCRLYCNAIELITRGSALLKTVYSFNYAIFKPSSLSNFSMAIVIVGFNVT